MTKLNEKQMKFCREYISCNYNATAAYLKVYDEEGKMSREVAASGACKLMSRQYIKDYIAELQKEAFEAAAISAERVALKLAEIAFSEKSDEDYAASAKLKALDLLQKQLGLQTQKVEADVSQDIVITIGGEK